MVVHSNGNTMFLGELQAKRIAQNVLNLPTLPTVIAKMMQVMDDPRTTVAQLSRLISSDQVLSAKLLKLANSAFYGIPRKVATLELAIVMLGFENLKTLALGVGVIDRFSDNWNDAFDYTEFWEHAFGCAVASRIVAHDLCPDQKGEAFVAGLLHDVGKLILSQFARRHFAAVIEKVSEYNADFYSVEKAILGVSHTEIGAWFAEKWNFPTKLVEALQFHHTPNYQTQNNELAAAVHFADYLVRLNGIGFCPGKNLPEFDITAFAGKTIQRNACNEIDFDYYSEKLRIGVEESDTFLKIIARGMNHAIDK